LEFDGVAAGAGGLIEPLFEPLKDMLHRGYDGLTMAPKAGSVGVEM